MPQEPMEEWRRLTALYSEMGEIEIRDLADQIDDLTPNAQQVLRDEIKKRGITPQQSTGTASIQPTQNATVNWEPANYIREFSKLPGEEVPHEYTWKVPLCDCETTLDAWRIAQMLKRAGIDSWIETP